MATSTPLSTPVDDLAREALTGFPSGVVCLAGTLGHQRAAMVASSFAVGISWNPPLVSFAAQKSSTTWPRLRQAAVIGVSVLSTVDHDAARQLSSRDAVDRLAGLQVHHGAHGGLLLTASSMQLETTIHAELPAGDHVVVLLEVLSVKHSPQVEPVIYHRSLWRELANSSR